MIDVEAVRREAGPCPTCGVSLAKPILWGMPVPGDMEEFGDTVSWGGCCLPEVPAAYRCGRCGREYGVARFGDE